MRIPDVDRPLNSRGKKDAPFMADKCKINGYIPDVLISSVAKRASTTAKMFIKEFGIDKSNIRYEKSLYHAPEDEYINVCYGLENSLNSVMMFGHNPGITYLANSVSESYIDNVPTCGVLIIDSTIDKWIDLDFSNSHLVDFIYPKLYL